MRDIAELPGITVAAIELLREAGIKTVEQFIDGDVSENCSSQYQSCRKTAEMKLIRKIMHSR